MFFESTRFDSADKLWESGCFPNKQTLAQFLIMDELAQRDVPLGSMKLKIALQTKGFDISEANIGRYLAYLDMEGYTEVQKTQGRFLTCKGRDYIGQKKQQVFEKNLQNRYLQSIKVETLDDLVRLLELRRLLECEAVALAVENGTEDDRRQLEKNITDHRRAVEMKSSVNTLALDFHYKVAFASHHNLLQTLICILVDAEAALEAKEPTLLTREKGPEYQVDHEALFKDIFVHKNAQKAREDMHVHITQLINAIKETQSIKR